MRLGSCARLLASLAVLPLVTAIAWPVESGQDRAVLGFGRLDSLARSYVERGQMPGVVFEIGRGGRIVHTYRVGMRDVENRVAISADTIFRVYSMTKPVTGVAVMQLIESGKLRLSDPVADHLSELGELRAWAGGTLAAPETEPARPITVEHLLTHTSGLTYGNPSTDGAAALYAAADLYSGPDLATFVERLSQLPLASQPGTRWEYGVSIDVLGRLVEVVSGEPFDRYLERHIFRPLGMADTGFRVPPEKVSRFAALYARSEDGGITRIEDPWGSEYLGARPVPFGGHGLVSTAGDYGRFAWMLANGGQLEGVRILSVDSIDSMMSDHLGAEYGPHPLTDSWLGDDALGLGFGLSGAVVRDGDANGVPGSTGAFFWGGAASTFFWVDRTRGLIGLQFTQLMPSNAYPIRSEVRRLTYEALIGDADSVDRSGEMGGFPR